MPASLEGQLVVAISSRALFDFEEENRLFEAGDDALLLGETRLAARGRGHFSARAAPARTAVAAGTARVRRGRVAAGGVRVRCGRPPGAARAGARARGPRGLSARAAARGAPLDDASGVVSAAGSQALAISAQASRESVRARRTGQKDTFIRGLRRTSVRGDAAGWHAAAA